MNRFALLLIMMGVLVGSGEGRAASGAGNSPEDYLPPELFRSLVESPAPSAPADGGGAGNPAAAETFDALRAAFDRAIANPLREETFLLPDPGLAQSLRSAADADGAAAAALADGFSLETLETLALSRNAAVRTAEAELRAVMEGYGQAEALDGMLRRYAAVLSTGTMPDVGGAEPPDAPGRIFPFPGVLALRGEVATQEAREARERLEAARRDAVTAARSAYWELLYLAQARRITGDMVELMRALKDAARSRYEAGEGSFGDLLRAGVEIEKTREMEQTLVEEEHTMRAMVREALALPPETAVGVPALREPTRSFPSADAIFPVARDRRQELRRMRATIAKMEKMIEMTETMVYPSYDLGFSGYARGEVGRVGTAGGMGGGETFPTRTEAGMGAGLPKMPWFGVDDAYVKELRLRTEGMKSELRMEEVRTELEVRRSWAEADRSRREEALYADRVVALSRASMEAAGAGYTAGTQMFADVLERYVTWYEANESRERARADLGIAAARLDAAAGVVLSAPTTGK